MSLDYNEKNITLAQNLRKNATPQENHLWYDFLSKYEVRSQRQKAIDHFIADFYSHKQNRLLKLVVRGIIPKKADTRTNSEPRSLKDMI